MEKTKFLTPKERKLLESNFKLLLTEYRNNGSLRLDLIIPIIGTDISKKKDSSSNSECLNKISEIESILKSKL